MDAYRNNDALDTPEMDAERARLDAVSTPDQRCISKPE